jgi:uncharacterized transporter YbjL
MSWPGGIHRWKNLQNEGFPNKNGGGIMIKILIMAYFTSALQQHPELAIFLTLAIGFFIGRIKTGSFSLGTVVGTLFADVLIGQLNIHVPFLIGVEHVLA